MSGQNLQSIYFICSLVERLLLLAGMCFAMLGGLIYCVKRMRLGAMRNSRNMPMKSHNCETLTPDLVIASATANGYSRSSLRWNSLVRVLPFIAGLVLGYGARSIQSYNHTARLENFQVIQKYSDSEYQIRSHGEVYKLKFCDDYAPDWDEGMTVEFMVYEDRGSCKSIADHYRFGFKIRRDPTGKFVNYHTEE